MNHQLRPGLHVAIVTNPCGHGGSLFAWETYQACKLSGVPAILATFDQDRRYPDLGIDLRRLPVPDGETPGQSGIENLGCLLPIVAEARSMNKFLIIDTRTGFRLQDPMFEVLEYCGIPAATSTAALIPIKNRIPEHLIEMQCGDFREIEISFTRALVRSWAKVAEFRLLPILHNFPEIQLWRSNNLTKLALAMIHDGHPSTQYEQGLPLPDLFGHICGQKSRVSKNDPRQEIKRHLHTTRKAIFDDILAPISQPSQ